MSASAVPERVCIQRFGISYHEIITNLVTDSVLSEAESRMVLLILGSDALPVWQQHMLEAVMAISNAGITRATVTDFRRALTAVGRSSQKGTSSQAPAGE